MARKSKKNNLYKFISSKWGILGLVIIASLIGASVWGLVIHDEHTSIPTNGNPSKPAKSYVNLSPATDQDKQNNDSHKEDLSQQPTPSTTSNGKKAVTPVITHTDKSTVNGYVSGVFEDGGTCTAAATNVSTAQVVTKSSQGFENASYTSCTPISFSLGPGSWRVVLSYSSAAAEGSSAASEVH